MSQEVEDFLAHYGVKGMKWGVVNDKSGGAGGSGSGKLDRKDATFSKTEAEVVKKLVPKGFDEARMRRMYGPDSLNSDQIPAEGRKLTDGQKKALKIAGGVAVAGVGLYALNKYGEKLQMDAILGPNAPDSMKEFWKTSQKTKGSLEAGYSKDFVKNLSNESVKLPAGSIVKRLSSAKENSIRPGGFFAAYKDEDVNRYKAVLPIYWKAWGVANKDGSGYIVNLKAKEAVNAPSPKKTYEMLTDFLNNDDAGKSFKQSLKIVHPKLDDEGLARKAAPLLAGKWNMDKDPQTKAFLKKVKASGYNALVDLNDAGSLGDSPMRFIDSSIFSIDSHTPLKAADIRAAQASVVQLTHALILSLGGTVKDADEFLEHFGVKGMKWGVRNNPTGASRSTNREARKDAEEHARAAMFYGQGAGTRRKLINKSVESKKSKDPSYAKAFDSHRSNQDISKHASGARKERGKVDRRDKTKKRAGYFARRVTGEQGTQAAFMATVLGGAAFVRSPRGQALVKQATAKASGLMNSPQARNIQKQGAAFLKQYMP